MKVGLYGFFLKPLSFLIPIKKKCWIFGSDYGKTYREGSKYMLEYMLKNHPEYDCIFITLNHEVKRELDAKLIPCRMNFSIRGMWLLLRAEVVITTQATADIQLVYKKKGRRCIFLSHGQPYKVAFKSVPKYYWNKLKPNNNNRLTDELIRFFTAGYHYSESDFFTSTSEFLVEFNKLYYGKDSDIRVLGMPRNDALFHDEEMKQEKWIDGTEGKFIITYMPTHRKYGQGELSPSPFIERVDYQEWMRENNVVLLVKQHPNMIPKLKDVKQTDVIRDITCDRLDSQVCLYHSDVLITDNSSVWIDYLLLERPLIFYYYDKFEDEDTGVLYDIREDPPGHFCKTEDELFQLIKKTKEDYDSMRPSEHIISKYHKYVDGNSCERYFKAIVNGKD